MVECKDCKIQKKASNCQHCKNITKNRLEFALKMIVDIRDIVDSAKNDSSKIERLIYFFANNNKNIISKFAITPNQLFNMIRDKEIG